MHQKLQERWDTLAEPLQPEKQSNPVSNDDLGVSAVRAAELSAAQSERKADELSSLLAAIVESSDDAIISSTLGGTIISWNKGAERIFGYTAAEMLGQPTSVLGSHAAEEDPDIVLAKIRDGQRVDHYETLRRHKDGSDIVVSLTVSPVHDSAGRIIAVSKVARDITSTRHAEQALRNADKLALAGRMAASIAHEINNPLEAITNLLFLLQQENLTTQASQYLDLAQRELMRVSHIASQTLGFFRGAPVADHYQVTEIVDSAISLHTGRLLVSNITVKTNYQPVAPLFCHQGEMRQVLVNLVSNALDAMSSPGRLLIRVRPATDIVTGAKGIRITVADTGSGMSPKTLRQLFDPFYTTKGASGTGLGLWVTQQIVHRHKGRISIRSSQNADRHGTVFCLFFPHGDPTASDQTSSSKSDRKKHPSENGSGNQATSLEDASRHTLSELAPQSTAYSVA